MVTAILAIDFSRESWSMSCSAPLFFNTVGAAPPSRIRGVCAIWAFLSAVIELVTPGPAVTAATPGTPEIRPTASAANTALTSSLTSTTRIPSFLAPVRIGDMWPPQRVNKNCTPRCRNTCPMMSPLFISIISSNKELSVVGRPRTFVLTIYHFFCIK